MQFVGAPPAAGCIFCDKVAEDRDAENLILHRGAAAFVILNLYPYNSGHLMVAPYLHSGDMAGLSATISGELWSLAQRAVAALTSEYRPEGYNLGMNLGKVAGAGIPDHLHIHVVPRWGGDTNFMPLTAETKVLPESLDQTYARLKPHFGPA
jgi:ATP adenylyltransferase